MANLNTAVKTISGRAIQSDTCSERCNAMDFGASSPNTMCRTVAIPKASANDTVVTVPSDRPARCSGPFHELENGGPGDKADPERRHGDAELRRGDVQVEVADRLLRDQRGAVAFLDQLVDPGSADADERELRRDEKAVHQDQHEQGHEAENVIHL
jgi:hypothetical protein